MDVDMGVLLVHTRLAIVGLGEPGRQPHKIGSSVLVYNGEIYNHARVAAALGIEPPACDTLAVHEILRREDVGGLSMLDGMFALAWWDGAERRLIVARDQWGIKPLYVYRHPDGGITVASEIAALAPLRLAVDPYGLAHYVAFGHTTSTATIYERVTKLPPGTHAETRMASTGWRTSSGTISPPTGSGREVGELVTESVRDQLMADVPLGVFLSGGVDSSLVAAAAVRAGAAPRCFTLSFPETPLLDESTSAARNANRLDLPHTVVPVTAELLASRLSPLLASAGEPIGDPAALAVDVLAEQASGYVKVVLTGEGADELFGGYVRHRLSRHLALARAWTLAPLFAWPARLVEAKRSDQPWQRACAAALRGGGAIGYSSLQEGELSVFADRKDDLLRVLIAELRTDWAIAVGTAGRERAAVAFDQKRWLPNTYLEKVDRATMRHGLEARVPFLSGALTAWASDALPFGKQPIVKELKQLLPRVELPPKKKGLAIDVRALLDAGLDTHVERLLKSEHSVLRNVLGAQALPGIEARARRSPAFAYRLATVGAWQDVTGFTT